MTPAPPPSSLTFRPGAIAPRAAVVLGLVLCLVGVFFLIPDRDELLRRHLSDGDAPAVMKYLEDEGEGAESNPSAAFTVEAMRVCEKDAWDEDSLAILSGSLRNSEEYEQAIGAVLKRAEAIPQRVRVQVFDVLIELALGNSDVALAEAVQMRLLDSVDVLTPALVRKAVKTFRYNNNSELALHTINKLEESGQGLPADLEELRVVLARGIGKPDIAFALLKQRILLSTDPTELKALIPQAVKTGVEAGRQNDLIPLYERYLSLGSDPAEGPVDPLRDEYSLLLARTYEWTTQPDKAFDVYLGLAAHGHRESLDRCLALNPGLYRTNDLRDMLVGALARYPGDTKLLLFTARLLAEAARRGEAIELFRRRLGENPDDAEVHYRLGLVFDEMQEFEKALHHFERASSLDPENSDYTARAAAGAVALGAFESALVRYRELGRRTLEMEHVEQFHTLSKVLGDEDAIVESYGLLIESGGPFEINRRLSLAHFYRTRGELARAVETLEAGMKAHPANGFIRVELAELHDVRGRPERALQVLKPVSFAKHPMAATLAVYALGNLAANPGRGSVRSYLSSFGRRLEASDELDSGAVLQLAELFRGQGDGAGATRLFRRVVRGSSVAGNLARAHFYLGQARLARGYQLEHIRESPRPSADDYRMLGDIHTQLADEESARRAYRTALSLLKRRSAAP